MTNSEKLRMLKMDLQMLTSMHDDYLKMLLASAKAAMQREGIEDDGSADYETCQIQYAAYLYRKRAADNTAMPRFLRWNLNNILISQKARAAE